MQARSTFTPPGAPLFSDDLALRLRAGLEAQGPSYAPRTHHLHADGKPKFVNRLILETSPYLLQHAHNPVSWWAWSSDAFAAAKSLGRPILLSIGYSTCHWCHVMEVESFEDLEIATYINEHFIPIKVDREERPDVDTVYMNAVQLMNDGGGGWPMTVVLTPDGRPFFGGTYFPPRDGARGVRMGFLSILKRLVEVYEKDPSKVTASADQLHAVLRASSERIVPQGLPGPSALGEAVRMLVANYDPRFGGFGGAPKFPRPSTYDLLLRYFRRTGDEAALHVVAHSLANMIDGGIYDQLGGGFHRYSTDERWLVPHFEKMLYDNAQLVSTLLETYQASGDEGFSEAARETLEYVLREMTSPEGAFYSATDADSEGEEGRFFVWTQTELEQVLGKERANVVGTWFGVTKYGNFEGRNILHRPHTPEEAAHLLDISPEELGETVEHARSELYAARKKRVPPLLDDKILTEWNAQMISAFAQGAIVLGEPRYAATATRAADFVLGTLTTKDGRLLRAHRAGQAKHAAVLEDHAFFIAALLDLFEATGTPRWLEKAIALQADLDLHFRDPRSGAYFGTADDAEVLLVREVPTYDGAQPSGNSIAALNLLRLAELTGRADYRTGAEKILMALGASLERAGVECPKLATALDWYHDKPKEIVLVTTKDDDGAVLRATFAKTHVPNHVFVAVEEGEALSALAKLVPLALGKRAMNGKATAYVCTMGVCEAPTSSPEVLARELKKVEPLPLQKKKKLELPR